MTSSSGSTRTATQLMATGEQNLTTIVSSYKQDSNTAAGELSSTQQLTLRSRKSNLTASKQTVHKP